MACMENTDYHVTFPTKCQSIDHTHRAENPDGPVTDLAGLNRGLGQLNKKDQNPVVFLLGWYGCRDNHLAKYSALYETRGFVTIRYVLHHDYIFGRKMGRIRSVALELLDSLFELGLEQRPVFFHLFSNGGGYIYRHVTEIVNGPWPGRYCRLRIAGIIWDSSPVRPYLPRSFLVVYIVLSQKRHWVIAYLGAWLFYIFLGAINVLSSFGTNVFGLADMTRDRRTYFDAVLQDKMASPMLFLYSKGDRIVPCEDVQAAIAERRRRGCHVTEVLWDDSDHVMHLRRHPERYAAACREFVEHCLNKIDN